MNPARLEVGVYREFALPHYAGKDPAHGPAHVHEILTRLGPLSEGIQPPPRLDWLYFLACFHGLAARVAGDPDFRTAVVALLDSLGWAHQDTAEALIALDRHATASRTIEERIVYDANAMGRIGAFGIAKAFTTGGGRGQTYEETLMYYERALSHTEFKTPRAQAVAEEGMAYARAFLKRFRREARIPDPAAGA